MNKMELDENVLLDSLVPQQHKPFRSKLSSLRMQTRARNLVTSFRYSTVVLLSLMMANDSLS